MRLLLTSVLLSVTGSFCVGDGDQTGLPPSVKYRTWKRSVKECGADRCFLPWIRRNNYSPFPEFFVDYKKDIRDGYLLACPMGYILSEAVGLDPFRLCYTDPETPTMIPSTCWSMMTSTFGYPQQAFCSPKDPCFEDHRLALRVTNVSLTFDLQSHNGTLVSYEGVDFLGWNAFFSLYSNDEGHTMCTITDGFRTFDLTLQLSLPTSIQQEIDGYFKIEYNITILTTCATSNANCTGDAFDFSSSNNIIAARQLNFAKFDSLLSDNSQEEACLPFRTPFGMRVLLCIDHENQQTLFSPPKPPVTANATAEYEESEQTQHRNIKLFLW